MKHGYSNLNRHQRGFALHIPISVSSVFHLWLNNSKSTFGADSVEFPCFVGCYVDSRRLVSSRRKGGIALRKRQTARWE
jgi:hypothetical protein